ncbi:HNH endonuclease family protein [Actinomadura opuntiae]|uniref:HNH endonuclease family protein n=1 Tax=Actinomadura sp. OS1-43 TaxID=604315 RepID=UPI00255ACB05|nr:HNH endonuclease family protein [Actinomadura sp. OS1-43]MDL4821633.1 HNH endonuclease family protein [Actinomadura sp. OS1-43]
MTRRERVRRDRGRTALAAAALALALPLLASGCKTDAGATGSGGSSGGSGSGPAANDGHSVSPLDNPDGTKPGLAAITSSGDRAKARALIGKVDTKGRGPKTGYERDEFGYAWMDNAPDVPFARNGCDTRNDLLKRDGQDIDYRSGSNCVIMSLTLADPYSGKTIHWKKSHATAIQIDHVMPLSYDWQMGASRWSKDKRESIANDPLNLIPVDGPLNGAKSDSGPASWLPPNKRVRCSYSVRFAQVSLKYHLPVTTADKKMMLSLCGA